MLAAAFDRLSVRLAVGITVLVASLLAIGLYALSQHHFDHTLEAQRRAAELQNRILEATLRHQMMERDTTLIMTILREIGSQPEVRNAMILDHEGAIRFSSDAALVGQRFERDSATCMVCHSKSPAERDNWALLEGESGGALRSVLPIENRAECHQCHDPANRLNGILILDLSLAGVRAELRSDAGWMTAGTALLALLVLAGMILLVRRFILVRLSRLRRTARSIAGGNMDERAVVEGDDTISALATEFNSMADSVSQLLTEVREQEAQLEAVMNGLEDGLVVLDQDARVVASNRSFCRKLGVHPESLRGLRCCDAMANKLPCRDSDGDCPAELCLATGEVQRAVFQIPSGAGETDIVEEVYASPVYDEAGTVVQVVELWRDISERVKEEERLAEIERLVSLGALASGFSHQLNTPMASMLTCAEAALGRIGEAGPGDAAAVLPVVAEHARTIRAEVLRCRSITKQFLRFSRGVPPSIEPIDLRKVVASVVSLAAPTAREAGATIRLEGDDRLPAVRANTEVVQHVVLNLLVNAIQSFEGRERTVTVRFRVKRDVLVEVEDSGCGIPPEARRHLFEPFRSRKPRGTGLGLFLSRSFMRRFGGDVRLVRSEVGAGSCFEILFLRAGDQAP